MRQFLAVLAFVLAAFPFAWAAPNGGIQSDVAICDPNAPSICEALAGVAPVATQVTCTTAGTVAVLSAVTTSKAAQYVSNQSGATVYLGPSGVSSSTGFPLPTGAVLDVTKATSGLYCATASSTAVIGVLQY